MTKDEFVDGINALKRSEWFNRGKEYKELIIDGLRFPNVEHVEYLARKEAVEIVCDLFIKDFESKEVCRRNEAKPQWRDLTCRNCGYRAGGLVPDFLVRCPICNSADIEMNESEETE